MSAHDLPISALGTAAAGGGSIKQQSDLRSKTQHWPEIDLLEK
jgi:hypothetical protein